MTSRLSAVSDTASVLSYTGADLRFGFALLHGEEDENEGVDASFYGTRTATGVIRAALPDLSGRNSLSAEDILMAQEEEHELADYGDAFDRIEAKARRARPDNSEGVVQAYRAADPGHPAYNYEKHDRARRFKNRHVRPVIVYRDLGTRSRRNDRVAPMASNLVARADSPAGIADSKRAARERSLAPIVGAARAQQIAAESIGTLGAKLLANPGIAKAAAALDVKAQPAPHRARHVREGVVARTNSRS